ncbi:hypothetical protein [Ichthyenterobacterium magnum]|uniref:Uncharacterized protein n=1 Tax=Ichthyenterobacterium magnum TaxID=1230530 RepID=A0A420DGY1_9FLAO|nr:hypothetical protein [Ichthyenterobacterium magnum]RKE92336.1 hypothetical protein BXY80_2255 [Ichthyenterobacterium magnum]
MENNKNIIDPEKIHLEFIEEISVSMGNIIDKNIANLSISTDIAHISGYNMADKKYLLGLKVVFTINHKDKPIEFKFRYNFHYRIDNYDEMYSLKEDGTPFFSKIFVATLAGISYSTLRGIIFEKTSNSSWVTLTLPVINPSLVLDSWIDQN